MEKLAWDRADPVYREASMALSGGHLFFACKRCEVTNV
jgi:hypothetical protein